MVGTTNRTCALVLVPAYRTSRNVCSAITLRSAGRGFVLNSLTCHAAGQG